MANLQQDLLNKLGNDKYYAEIELSRLAADPNMVYKQKIEEMTTVLNEIASIDLSIQLVGKYFREPVQPEQPQPKQSTEPESKPHPGQSHGE